MLMSDVFRKCPADESRTSADFPFCGTVRKIGVLLADDHRMMRKGICSLLEGYSDIAVVGEASNGEEAVRLARELRPDVILMDVSMPRMNGVEATVIIHSESPLIRIIGLSMYTETELKGSMFDAGAEAYLSKDADPEELLAAIRGANGNRPAPSCC